jgi:SET family sugar efflux transporter-like MFS transporter
MDEGSWRGGDRSLLWIGGALGLAGIGLAMRTVLLPLFAYRELGASRAQVGLVSGLSTGVSVLASVLMGRFSDRVRRRGALVTGAALWMAAGCLLGAGAGAVNTLLVLAVLFFSMATVPSTLLLAIGGDLLVARGPERLTTRMAILRASVSAGFALGPAVVALVAARQSLRTTLVVSALPWLGAAAIAAFLRMPPARHRATEPGQGRSARAGILFALGFALLFTFDAARSAFVSVFAVDDLHASMGHVAAIFSSTALLNVAFIPLAGVMADRFGPRRVILVGGLAGSLGAFGFAACSSTFQLIALQGLHALYVCSMMAVGVTSAHALFEGSSGLGMGLFNAGTACGALLAGTFGGLLAARFGWRAPFAASGVACAAGVVLLLAFVLPPSPRGGR